MISTKDITKEILKKEPKIKVLFKKSFPPAERLPISLLLRRVKNAGAKFVAYYEDNDFIGISYSIPAGNKKTYILYIAVVDEARGKGYGTIIINRIKEQCIGDTIFLSIDEISEKYDDYELRKKRQVFYEKNGFILNDFTTKDFGMVFNIMSYNGLITKSDFDELVDRLAGKVLKIFYK